MVAVYLDHNATTPVRPAAAAAVAEALAAGGNPSSVHGPGRAARARVEAARRQVAALVGAEPGNVVFTSGATEALNLVLAPRIEQGAERRPFDRLILSAIEHPAALEGHRFPKERAELVPVTAAGVVDLAALEARLAALAAAGERAMVAVMAANNETGVVQPWRALAGLVHAHGGFLVVDAVQAAGRLPISLGEDGMDALVLSSHKIGGPPGAGALVLASQAIHLAEPLLKGGGQEGGRRAGTQNMPAIAGFGVAAAEAATTLGGERQRLAALRDRLEAALAALAPEAVIAGQGAERLANTSLAALPGVEAETAVIALDLAGLAVSSGAACSSGKVKPSHVLAAMGLAEPLTRGALRFSLGWTTTAAEIEAAIEILGRILPKLRSAQPAWAA